MTKLLSKRVLVAVDGSKRSLQTVAYMAQTGPFRGMEINLYHVFNAIPEEHWDLEKEHSSINATAQLRAWESQQRKNIETHLEACKALFLEADFNPNRIKLTIQNRKQGIARDIIAESHNGYDVVVLRRRGRGNLPGIILGSVAYKLLNNLHVVPLILAGREPANNRVLVPTDGSESAHHALDFAGRMLAGHDYEITLVHVLRKMSAGRSENDTQPTIQNTLNSARTRLEDTGFDQNKISIEIITDAPSRAGAIVQLAKKGNYSTIVMGRKGISHLAEFVMGGVTNKVIHVGRKFHIWMVN
jgi:nucleotide-binding universal stress UspA family protein